VNFLFQDLEGNSLAFPLAFPMGHRGSPGVTSPRFCQSLLAEKRDSISSLKSKYEASGDQKIEIPWPWRKKGEFHGKVFT
jgi:hypothetical protein